MEGEATEEGITWKIQYKNVKNNQLIKGFIFEEVPKEKRSTSPQKWGKEVVLLILFILLRVCQFTILRASRGN